MSSAGKAPSDAFEVPPNVSKATSGTELDKPKETYDPLEDDLDDLDDLLDDFGIQGEDEHNHGNDLQSASEQNPAESEQDPAEAFSKQLQEQMATLLGNDEQSAEAKGEIDQMLKELGAASVGRETETLYDKGPAVRSEAGFQQTVRRTLDRMESSGNDVSEAAMEGSDKDFLEQMLKNVPGMDLEGVEGDEGFSTMLMGMMEKLTDKDILYEPMKELSDKFPTWLHNNRENIGVEDLERFETQQRVVSEIVQRFEEKDYSDSRTADREFIVTRMQQMQAAGNPPADLVGDTDGAQEALGDLGSGCAQQ